MRFAGSGRQLWARVAAERKTAEGWAELEDAVGRRDWEVALGLAQAFERDWQEVRGFVEIFVGLGTDTWARPINKAMKGLLDALSESPVDPVVVDGVMSRFRVLMP